MADTNAMTLEDARKVFPPIWTVYRQPADFPHNWVVRCWFGEIPDPHHALCHSLIEARQFIEQAGGSFCLHRQPGDAASIVESWI